jgi:hypothetical protein
MRRRTRSRVRIAALLLCASLALPAPAVASNGPSIGSTIFDCAVLRPFGFVATIIGGAFFVPAAALASPSGAEGIRVAWEHFVVAQVENTFTRPLGEF